MSKQTKLGRIVLIDNDDPKRTQRNKEDWEKRGWLQDALD